MIDRQYLCIYKKTGVVGHFEILSRNQRGFANRVAGKDANKATPQEIIKIQAKIIDFGYTGIKIMGKKLQARELKF